MQEIAINELKSYSPWVEKLNSFARGPRTEMDVFREYNTEKYQSLLSVTSMTEALAEISPAQEICYSRHNKLFVDKIKNVRAYYERLFCESTDLSAADVVVELGGGFGYHTHLLQQKYPDKKYIVGEFSPNARAIGERVTSGITFAPFNFYSDWDLLDGLQKVAVFTVHAVEMLPDAALFFNEINKHADTLASVTLFEPLYLEGTDELTVLRRKYINAHRYNKNIIEFAKDAVIESDFFGFNPLFPVSYIKVW